MTAVGEPRHDPGGRASFGLMPGVTGFADFMGDLDQHRIALHRLMNGTHRRAPFALWVGMNPSMAAADIDDLTCRKEQVWTLGMKLNRYMKMNIGTYRATYPDDLAEAARRGKCIIHPINRATMALQAQIAEVVVLATGRVPQCLEEEARAVFAMLKALVPEKLACLGMTATGWPKHPSRLGYSNKLRSFT